MHTSNGFAVQAEIEMPVVSFKEPLVSLGVVIFCQIFGRFGGFSGDSEGAVGLGMFFYVE